MNSKLMKKVTAKYSNGYKYVEQVLHNGRPSLKVTCPDHGDFMITEHNFLFYRGCKLCKGKHFRAFPNAYKFEEDHVPDEIYENATAIKSRYSVYVRRVSDSYVQVDYMLSSLLEEEYLAAANFVDVNVAERILKNIMNSVDHTGNFVPSIYAKEIVKQLGALDENGKIKVRKPPLKPPTPPKVGTEPTL